MFLFTDISQVYVTVLGTWQSFNDYLLIYDWSVCLIEFTEKGQAVVFVCLSACFVQDHWKVSQTPELYSEQVCEVDSRVGKRPKFNLEPRFWQLQLSAKV